MAAIKVFYYLGSPPYLSKISRPLLRTLSTSNSPEVRAAVLENCAVIAEERPVRSFFSIQFESQIDLQNL